MKLKLILIALTAMLMFGSVSKAQVTEFHGDADSVFSVAHTQSKYILVDFYASWCGPCRKLDIAIASDTNLSQFINEKFIFLKLDVDSADGKKWCAKYNVGDYPTVLIFSSDNNSKPTLRIEGYKPSELLMKDLKYAIKS